MPRDGALPLSDVLSPALSIVCEPCSRHGRYSLARLVEEHGDAELTDLLQTLASCPKNDPPTSVISARWSTRGSWLVNADAAASRRQGGSQMTANRLLPTAIAALALARVAYAQ